MSAIPDLIGEQEAGPFWPAEVNRRNRERMAEVIKERDDLKLVLDRQNPWNEKAQELLDASRWAGHTLIEGCATELEETRAERDDAREQLSRICRELFDNDDTIGGESAADYVIRQAWQLRLPAGAKLLAKLPLSVQALQSLAAWANAYLGRGLRMSERPQGWVSIHEPEGGAA